MKKLSLEELEIENFAIQPSEQELTEIKGGTSILCIDVAAVVVTAAAAAYAAYNSSSSSSSSGGTTNNNSGNTTNNYYYNNSGQMPASADSVSVNPDGSMMIYGPVW